MLPALRGIRRRLNSKRFADRQDIESEIVLGFLTELRQIDPSSPNPGVLLRRSAFAHGANVRIKPRCSWEQIADDSDPARRIGKAA